MRQIDARRLKLQRQALAMGRGSLYVILDGGHAKIGHTRGSVSFRRGTLQCGNPRPLRIILHLPGAPKRSEIKLHHKLRRWRVRGKWYAWNDELREYLERQGFEPWEPGSN